MAALNIEPTEALEPIEFLRLVMRGLHSLCSQGPGRHFGAVGFYEDPESLYAQAMREAEAGRNVWFGVHPLAERPRSGRGGAEDVAEVGYLAADLDWLSDAHADAALPTEQEVRGIIGDFRPAPTIIVETGHGIQAYWALRYPVSPDLGEQLTARLHTAMAAAGLKPERRDLASVLRVPGTLNMKTDEHPRVRVTHASPSRWYTRQDLDTSLPSLLVSVAPESTPVAALLPAPSSERPGDRWAARVEWREILEADGWTYVRADPTGEEYWTRPGKTARDGISATIGYKGSGALKVFTSASPPLLAGESYSKFAYLTTTRFGGDWSAASRWCSDVLDGPRSSSPAATPSLPAAEDDGAKSFLDKLKAETYQGIAGLASIPPVTWLVQAIVQTDSLFQIFAPSSAGKSFLAIDLACCVATGKKWHGYNVVTGVVVYVVAEGASGIRDRLAAWATFHNGGQDPLVYVITLPAMLHRWDEVGALAEWCAELGAVLVIIDTYARSTLGLDENDNTAAGLAIDGMDTIRRATGAAVGVVHHTGYTGNRGRGASALYGAMETVIAVQGDATSLSLTTKPEKGGKQKNGSDEWFVTLAKVVQSAGRLDENGQLVTTLVLASGQKIMSAEEAEDACSASLDALRAAATSTGLTKAEWLAQAVDKGVSRASFYRHLKRLSETDCLTEVVRQGKSFYLPKHDLSHAVSPVSHLPSQSSLTVSAALCAETGETRETRRVDIDPMEDF